MRWGVFAQCIAGFPATLCLPSTKQFVPECFWHRPSAGLCSHIKNGPWKDRLCVGWNVKPSGVATGCSRRAVHAGPDQPCVRKRRRRSFWNPCTRTLLRHWLNPTHCSSASGTYLPVTSVSKQLMLAMLYWKLRCHDNMVFILQCWYRLLWWF